MALQIILKLIFILTLIGFNDGANILYAIPFTSKSHYILLRPIGLELASRGHNVTVITPILEMNHAPSYHQVMVDNKEIWDFTGGKRPNVFTMVGMSAEEFHEKILWFGGYSFTEVALNSTQVKELLSKDNKFDLVIAELFYQEALYMLAHKYQTPLVLIDTYGNCMRHNIITRNPLQLATVVPEFLDVKEPKSFWGRLRVFYFTVYEFVWWKYWYMPKHEQLVTKYLQDLPQPVPSLYDLQKNASLTMINTHFTFDPPTAYLPNIVEIGGVHLTRSDGKLPSDLKKILDDAKHGVIYVNFGSNVRSSELPPNKRDAFLNVFRGLKQTVLWKWEDEKLVGKPDNLIVRKWFPQKEILSHHNIQVFISHGGMIGTQEAIFHGVPIVGIPIYADQYNNLLQIQEKGFGIMLQYKDIDENTLKNTLKEVLENPSYKENSKVISRLFKDRPMTALQTAMFWIEYVIRNNGAEFIKNPARDLTWVAYNMLDVYAFILMVALSILLVIFKLVSVVFALIGEKDTKKSKSL